MKKLHPALQYAKDIQTGKIISCEWVKLAVQRHFNDLERDFEHYFDETAADTVLEFFSFLQHSKGEWAGQIFELEPWQIFQVYMLFGWKHKETGMRRFRTFYLEVARKNGKTTLAAGIGLYLMDGDDEPGAEIYAAATKFDQAKICHVEAERMVKSSIFLKDHLEVHVNNIFNEYTNSFFRPLGRDHDSLDGLNTHGCIIDEVHAHKTRDLWDVIETSTGARRQSLIFAITTAGFNRQTLCFELHDHTKKILEGAITDDTFLGFIYTIDEEDDWEDESLWIKANPNLNVSVKLDDLQAKAKRAKEIPSALNSFLRLHLNVWTESETRWIPQKTWMTCAEACDLDSLKGQLCYGGLDLSSNKDITAFVLCFPPTPTRVNYIVLCRFFIPKSNMTIRVHNDRVPYDVWERQGLLTATPGTSIDYNYIINQIGQDVRDYDLAEIAFDRWGATKIVQDLADLGFEKPEDNPHAQRFLIPFGQGYISMNSPMKELENLILAGKISHGGNPVLSWMASNVVVSEDPAGNIKPDKKRSIEKIDGIVAMIMALDRALKQEHGKKNESMPIFI
jgi:phage terminase large subunit-like protein